MSLRHFTAKPGDSATPNREDGYSEEYFDIFRPARGIVRGIVLGSLFWLAAIYFGWEFILNFIRWM